MKHPDGIAWIYNLPESGGLSIELSKDAEMLERVAEAKLAVRRRQADVDVHRSRVLALVGANWTAEEISRAKGSK